MNPRVDLPPVRAPSRAERSHSDAVKSAGAARLLSPRDDLRARRLGTALSGMAQDLASARREIAMLRRENETLRMRLDGADLR